ncbi:pyridoxal-phosphate dependent enzyme [Acetomicrobium sp. UBA5826]|uniref:pyridoxal-phosphate dependent enzyme n=1 Tax=Acetomicrobium sp. UBA5826 TaxID=1946039 RepID=UPI00257DF8A0|nr:pyridoxal-phosphate dependent enzyme [Acetomicrobium sp. UBA5826]
MKAESRSICSQTIDLNLLHIYEAKKRISPLVRHTPLVKSNPLSSLFNHDVFLKLEFLQDPGAFKVRGATNKILSLSPTDRKRGVVTFSTGNHGLCTCWVAKKTDTPAVVCVSKRVAKLSPKRIEFMRALGAEVVVSGDTQDEAGEMAKELVASRGLTLIHPFDDPFVIAGQGTIGLELLEDEPSISSVLVPLSGGGLISGIALAMKSARASIKVIGVSIENAPVMYESIKACHPIEMKEVDSIAESLLGGIGLDNRYTFEMVRDLVDEIVLVSEEEIENALSFTLENHHWLLEGAGVAGIAALLSNKASGAGKTAIILSGSNCEARSLLKQLQI